MRSFGLWVFAKHFLHKNIFGNCGSLSLFSSCVLVSHWLTQSLIVILPRSAPLQHSWRASFSCYSYAPWKLLVWRWGNACIPALLAQDSLRISAEPRGIPKMPNNCESRVWHLDTAEERMATLEGKGLWEKLDYWCKQMHRCSYSPQIQLHPSTNRLYFSRRHHVPFTVTAPWRLL